ncbi:pentatricopeptide repeat-containing protein-like isoform X3 [Salvia divinorum]
MDMTRHGIQHNLFSLQNLLKALGREKMVKELIQTYALQRNSVYIEIQILEYRFITLFCTLLLRLRKVTLQLRYSRK